MLNPKAKARVWTQVVFLDNVRVDVPEDRLQWYVVSLLESQAMPCAVSPLHNACAWVCSKECAKIDTARLQKGLRVSEHKPHVHLVIEWENTTTRKAVVEWLRDLPQSATDSDAGLLCRDGLPPSKGVWAGSLLDPVPVHNRASMDAYLLHRKVTGEAIEDKEPIAGEIACVGGYVLNHGPDYDGQTVMDLARWCKVHHEVKTFAQFVSYRRVRHDKETGKDWVDQPSRELVTWATQHFFAAKSVIEAGWREELPDPPSRNKLLSKSKPATPHAD